MSIANARPFDRENRPLKGEWVLIGESSSNGARTEMMGSVHSPVEIDTSTTQGYDAVKRQAKPFPVWIVLVAALAVGALVFFLMNRLDRGAPARRSSTTSSPNSNGDGGSAASGPPMLRRLKSAERHSATQSLFVFEVDLNMDDARLDASKPAVLSVVGGELMSQRLSGGRLEILVRKTGAGSLTIQSLNYDPDGRSNPASPSASSAIWSAPAASPPAGNGRARSISDRPPGGKPPANRPPPRSGGARPKDDQ